jgi:hypothetical protein
MRDDVVDLLTLEGHPSRWLDLVDPLSRQVGVVLGVLLIDLVLVRLLRLDALSLCLFLLLSFLCFDSLAQDFNAVSTHHDMVLICLQVLVDIVHQMVLRNNVTGFVRVLRPFSRGLGGAALVGKLLDRLVGGAVHSFSSSLHEFLLGQVGLGDLYVGLSLHCFPLNLSVFLPFLDLNCASLKRRFQSVNIVSILRHDRVPLLLPLDLVFSQSVLIIKLPW